MLEKKFDLGLISKYRDQLYGVAIIWIMLLHGAILDKVHFPEKLSWLDTIISHGNVGVDIFLFLSGMGLYFSFVKNSDIYQYTIKRMVRILTPYVIFAVPVYLYIDIVLRSAGENRIFLDISQVGFWSNGYHLTWYIPGILFCYFIYPYIYAILFRNDKHEMIKALVICAIIFISNYCMWRSAPKLYGNCEILLMRLPVFVLGSAAGKAIYEKRCISRLWVLLAFIVDIVAYFVIKNVKMELIYQRAIYFVLAIALIISMTYIFSKIRSQPIHRICAWFGGYSLELYLVHIMFRDIFMKSQYYTTHVWRKWLLIIVIAIVVGVIIAELGKRIQKYLLKLCI